MITGSTVGEDNNGIAVPFLIRMLNGTGTIGKKTNIGKSNTPGVCGVWKADNCNRDRINKR
jgi:hypothetical protein